MGAEQISVNDFLEKAEYFPVIDVRSPSEYNHAHIPGATSIPLFTDEERKQVGTAYKQQSREQAIKIGLDYFGPKMRNMLCEAEAILQKQKTNTILVHCWRGGMRSSAVAWLLNLYGFKVYTLKGGYKAYRNWVLQQFTLNYQLRVLAGYTGSGKTAVLESLKKQGQTVIDLEALAQHKGSAFGAMGMPNQPTTEQFENNLSSELTKAVKHLQQNNNDSIWLESESQRIGNINIPTAFYQQFLKSPVYFLEVPFEERLAYILNDYGRFDKESILNAIMRIRKRLGGLDTKMAINYLLEDNLSDCFGVLLRYYDKYYLKGLIAQNSNYQKVATTHTNAGENAQLLLQAKND